MIDLNTVLDEMATPCYCSPVLKLRKSLNNGHASMAELDNALNELGMLSTITDSRQDYLREKSKSQSLSSHLSVPEMCVLQMNSDFVTNFTFFKSVSSMNRKEDEEEDDDEEEKFEVSATSDDRDCPQVVRRRWFKSRKRHFRPYTFSPREVRRAAYADEINPLSRVPKRYAEPVVISGSSSSSGVTRQDSGGKSNPGSPVKSQKNVTNTVCSIPRSRSLDEISKLNLNECCSNEAGKAEIEIVSQRINNLHVS